MAHEFESGLFVGQPAWHGLGKLVEQAPTMEDAIVMAGLDWNVKLVGLQTREDAPRNVTHRATVRESDGSILGVVGPGFEPLQNKDAFGWFQPFIDAGTVELSAAGSLREGRRVWVLAKIKGAVTEVVKSDPVESYVLLAHGHDGSLAIRCGFTTVRVVCANTLKGALDENESTKKLVKIAHLKGAKDALDRVRSVMDLHVRDFNATAEQLRELARCRCDEAQLKRYVRTVFAGAEAANDENAVPLTVKRIVPLFEAGRGAELSRGTWWGAFNAVTEFTTHMRGKTADARVDAAWFGTGAAIANDALRVGLEMARAA